MRQFSEQEVRDYVIGRLDKSTAKALEDQSGSDADLKKRIHMEHLLMRGVRAFGQDAFKYRVGEIVQRRRRMRRWLYWGAAVVLAVLAALFFYLGKESVSVEPTPQVIFAQHYQSPQLMSGMRSGDQAEALDIFRELYAEKNWPDLIGATSSPMLWQDRAEVGLMRMIGLMETNDFKQAIEVAGQITDDDERYTDHIEWYRAMALLNTDQPEEGLTIIRQIAQSEDHDYQANARDALDQK